MKKVFLFLAASAFLSGVPVLFLCSKPGPTTTTPIDTNQVIDTNHTYVAPVITVQPQPARDTVNAGASINFTVTATGSPTPAYQWYKNGTPLGLNATLNYYSISSVQISDSGTYMVMVFNIKDSVVANSKDTQIVVSVQSNSVTLTVRPAPTRPNITVQPLSQSVKAYAAGGVTFTVTVAAFPDPTYQWQKNDTNINGATLSTFSKAVVEPADTGNYRVIVTNSQGSDTSNEAALTINKGPVINTQPIAQTASVGGMVTLRVSASAAGLPITYQWYHNTASISGATDSAFTIASVKGADAGNYYVKVTSSQGSTSSNTIKLTVSRALNTAACAGNPPAGMKCVTGGTFSMGSDNPLDQYAAPAHQVSVSSFYMDSTVVTQGDYFAVMHVNPSDTNGNPSDTLGNPLWPVNNVTWFDALLYCNARSKRDNLDTFYSFTVITTTGGSCTGLTNLTLNFLNNGYRLPTEAEWEYACRAGTTTGFYWGDDAATVDQYAWYFGNSNNMPHPVATKTPNAWKLYDMSGNVWEWCHDWDTTYTSAAATDPFGPTSAPAGSARILRGGSYLPVTQKTDNLRCAFRAGNFPNQKAADDGFRCVRYP
ncbi:MAG: SUMF1/EgtB/PvdO family nonheme iron enzyme [Chitinivibrionales bacterium]|nr:SUMF1/EgtB/PvdO family nonheme iron enzyme [Chitinivibrionales bacterium]